MALQQTTHALSELQVLASMTADRQRLCGDGLYNGVTSMHVHLKLTGQIGT